MEVTMNNNTISPLISGINTGEKVTVSINDNKKTDYQHEIKDPITMISNSREKIEESLKHMMDQKDLQNFLYMMIGFDIKLEADVKGVGEKFNLMA